MAKQINLYITQKIRTPGVSILPADTTVPKVFYTASADDAIMKALQIASTDTVTQVVQIIISDGVTDRVLGTVPVPAGAGTLGTSPSVDALAGNQLPGLPVDQNGKRVLPLEAGKIVKLRTLAAVTAAKQIDAIAGVEEY